MELLGTLRIKWSLYLHFTVAGRCFHTGSTLGVPRCSRLFPGSSARNDKRPYKPKDKKLLTSPQQFQSWCKTSDNRWDQTDRGIEEENEAESGSGTGRVLSTLTYSLLSSFFV